MRVAVQRPRGWCLWQSLQGASQKTLDYFVRKKMAWEQLTGGGFKIREKGVKKSLVPSYSGIISNFLLAQMVLELICDGDLLLSCFHRDGDDRNPCREGRGETMRIKNLK